MLPSDPPKGVPGTNLIFYQGSDTDGAWFDYEKVKHYTNAFIIQEGNVLHAFSTCLSGSDIPSQDSSRIQKEGIRSWKVRSD